MRIIFHGANAASFSAGFSELVGGDAEIVVLPDVLESAADRAAYASADVIVASKFSADLPRAERLQLLHVPGAGYDAIDLAALPGNVTVCNCFGHEQAIAEYVMSALLRRAIPLDDADRRLRQGDWTYWAGAPERVHGEIAGTTIGLLGFGHIGKAIAARAKAFEMKVHVANRSPVALSNLVDETYTLDQMQDFWASADAFVVSVPLVPETAGIVGAEAFAAMKPSAVILNVGRGATIDEQALYDALSTKRIAGAMIDTWYRYPSAADPAPQPATLPFSELGNLLMTPHMSGWTNGTITRRQRTIADNIRRHFAGEPCTNLVRAAT